MTRIPGTCARYTIRYRTLYVFCGGTSNRGEIRENLKLARRTYNGWRVNCADLKEAIAIGVHLYTKVSTEDYDIVRCIGFSRGGPIAALALSMIAHKAERELVLYAPKRGLCRRAASWFREIGARVVAYRWDLIPMLPPWYSGWRCEWTGSYTPWYAHKRAARDFAWERHRASRGD